MITTGMETLTSVPITVYADIPTVKLERGVEVISLAYSVPMLCMKHNMHACWMVVRQQNNEQVNVSEFTACEHQWKEEADGDVFSTADGKIHILRTTEDQILPLHDFQWHEFMLLSFQISFISQACILV
jgi:hypothetical protein